MALPLKSGADFYTQQALRMALHNEMADLSDHIPGSIYFNNHDTSSLSDRVRYRGLKDWHSVANMEDIEDVKDLIKALSGSSSESVASVLGRVITLEGYFSNGKAKDADLLDGHNSDYFATATTVNDLLDDYEAFKAVFADNSDDYINTWTEVKAFLDGIKNTEDLNAILLGINTELGKKADKATTLAGYGITDAIYWSDDISPANNASLFNKIGYGYKGSGWYSDGPIIAFGINNNYRATIQVDNYGSVWWQKTINGETSSWRRFLDDNNYASVLNNDYLRLDGSSVMAKDALLRFQVGDGLYDWNARRGQGFGIIDYNTKAETQEFRLGFHIGGSHYRLDISHAWGTNILAYRIYDQTATGVGPWISILDANNYSNLITNLNKNLSVPSVTIGGIKLSVVEGQLQIEGDAYATGQLSSGGIGSEGSGSGASGIVILEDWEKYDDTLAQVLGAGLGVGLRDKIAALESKATNVSVAQTLTSGKEIGAITIDGVATKLYAPSTYAWSEITSKPISLGGYGIIDAVRFFSSQQGNLATKSYLPSMLVGWNSTEVNGIKGDYGILNLPVWSANTESSFYATQIYSVPNATNLCWRQVTASTNGAWKVLLDDHNYESLMGEKFLKLSGGTISGYLGVKADLSDMFEIDRLNDASTAYITFKGNGNLRGRIGFDAANKFIVQDTTISAGHQYVIHSGNIGSYASLSGTYPQTSKNDWNISSGIYRVVNGTEGLPQSTGGNSVIHCNWDSSAATQLFLDYAHDAVYYRRKYGSWQSWKTLAFTDGSNSSGTWGIDISGRAIGIKTIHLEENFDLNTRLSGGGIVSNYASASYFQNKPSGFTYGSVLQIASAYLTTSGIQPNQLSGQLAWDINHGSTTNTTKHLWWRATGDGSYEYSNWKQIAFTDSTVAAAKVLVAPTTNEVVLGTNDNKRLFDFSNKQIYEAGASGIADYPYYQMFGDISAGASVLQGSKLVTLATGGLNRLWVNSSGNVTIGGSDLAGADYRLYVNAGRVRFASVAGEAPALGTMSNMAVAVGLAEYGMQSYVLGNGSAHIQVGRFDGTATAYSLCLNPLGGSVLIGKTTSTGETLQVNGEITVPNNSYYKVTNTSGATLGFAKLTTSNVLSLGYETAYYTGYDTALYGKEIALIYGTGNSTYRGFTLNSHGNVTIGDSDYAGESQVFNVQKVLAVSYQSKAAILNIAETNANTNYIHLFVDSNNTIANRPLVLQNGYGFVGIGVIEPQYKLDIDGSVRASNFGIFGSRLFVGGATDDGTTALQILGDGAVGHGIRIYNGWSSASFGSYRSGYYARTGGWANGFYQYSSSGDILGGLEFAGRNEDLNLIRFLHGANAILELSNNEATISGDLKVTGNIIADGQVSSGGVAEAGTGGATGGSGLERVTFTIPANTTSFSCEHNLATKEISVSIYEDGNDYQQVLADVYLDNDNTARIVFGAATDVAHKVVIIG